jgi:hypothetical protein
MSTRITAYRRTMTRAQSIDETGQTLQLTPWTGNTDRYEAFDEPITVELVGGARLDPGDDSGEPCIYVEPARPMTLAEALAGGYARIV